MDTTHPKPTAPTKEPLSAGLGISAMTPYEIEKLPGVFSTALLSYLGKWRAVPAIPADCSMRRTNKAAKEFWHASPMFAAT